MRAMNGGNSRNGGNGSNGRERVWAWLQVVAMGLLGLWCTFGAVRAVVQRVDVIVVLGFGLGAWAAWTLTRMAWLELGELSNDTEG